jgi:hypothetical protein
LPVVDMNSGRMVVSQITGEFKAADESLAGLEKRLDDLTGFARKFGDGLANIARQSDGMGDQLARVFAPQPVEAGVAATSGAMHALKTKAGLNDAVSSGGPESVFRAQPIAGQRNAAWLDAVSAGGTRAAPVQIPAQGGRATQRFADGDSGQHAVPPVNISANITVNPPPGANPRDIARQVVDELARLKIRGHG